tara:strand:- start:278 stop:562 length:285 start_codon:yes stop_codon:yes gene_type:complete
MANHYLDGVLLKETPLGYVEKTTEQIAADRNALAAELNRNERDALLAASDWTQANDSPLANDKKIEWATYRTALRDLPSSSDWPNVTFPEEPTL